MTIAPILRSSVPCIQHLHASPLQAIPPALEAALTEFGLLHAFRTQAGARRDEQARRIAEAGESEQRHHIADILDELANRSLIRAGTRQAGKRND